MIHLTSEAVADLLEAAELHYEHDRLERASILFQAVQAIATERQAAALERIATALERADNLSKMFGGEA